SRLRSTRTDGAVSINVRGTTVNLLDTFHARCAEHPGRIALIDPKGRATTYAALSQRAAGLAARWRAMGLGEGDRVLLALGFSADLYAALAALWRLGAVAVLPEPALGLKGVTVAMEAARPRAVLVDGIYRLLPWLIPALRHVDLRLPLREGAGGAPVVADLPDDAPALISFTTGSTGTPKGIVRSHRFMAMQEAAVAPLIGTAGRCEVDLVGFPVFVVANLGQGITSVLPDWPVRRIDKASGKCMARLIAQRGVTRLLLNPALVERLAEAGVPPTVHAVFTGGGPVFPDLLRRLRQDRPDLRVVAVYGSTEAEPIAEIDAAQITEADFAAMEAGDGLLAGLPVHGARVRVVDDEIQVAGGHVVQGYLDPARDAETKLHGDDGTVWHRTGDAGFLDAAGRLWLLGRLGGKVGGLWPFAIEVAARAWPGVRRAALAERDGAPWLAIEGDKAHLADWRARAGAIGIAGVMPLDRLPMDKRHGSKVDMARLQAMLV
ncbi:MAG: AMP-binding protein, partial [Sphingomonadales bacterium]|nr:AMP-binding protein [Sphingomonadales bacterium]